MRTPKPNKSPRSKVSKSTRSDIARIVVLSGESRHRFDALHRSLQDEYLPTTTTERLLVAKMAVAQWRQLRIWALEKATISHDTTHDFIVDASTRDALTIADQATTCRFFSNYEARCDRQFSRSLQRLIELRIARTAAGKFFTGEKQEK